jgi:hypothetical protein
MISMKRRSKAMSMLPTQGKVMSYQSNQKEVAMVVDNTL